MKRIAGWIGTGLLAVVPLIVTAYVLVWVVVTAESLVAPAIRWAFGPEDYVPGSGLVLAAITLAGIGLLVEGVVGRWSSKLIERLLQRLPVARTVYGAVRDVLEFVVPGQKDKDARRVVAFELRPDVWLTGFVTGPPIFDADLRGDGDARVAVYFPMSYQIGGYTLMLREADLEPLDMSVEVAMRSVLTAGMVSAGNDKPHGG